MYNRMAIQAKAMEKTVTGPTNSMVRAKVQSRFEGGLYGGWRRGAKPLWEGPKRRGYPPSPSFLEGEKGVDGKARDEGYKRLNWCRTHFVCSRCFKMAD